MLLGKKNNHVKYECQEGLLTTVYKTSQVICQTHTRTTSFIEILMHRPTDCLDLPLPIKQSRIII